MTSSRSDVSRLFLEFSCSKLVVEHFGMHHGQILYITKLLHGQDLGFCRELDKTGRV